MIPYTKTVTRRRKLANDAKRALSAYQVHAGGSKDADGAAQRIRLTRLLWAQAFISQALALETRGILGDLNATPSRTLAAAGLNLDGILGTPTATEGQD